MRRLKHPIIKEVSLALNPVNKKKFIFLKEEIMNEDLIEINNKLNSLLDTKDKEDFEKSANPLTVVSKKIDKLIEKKGEDKKTIQGILNSIKTIVDYLKQGKEKGYGYPKPVKKDEEINKEINPGLAKGEITAILNYLKKNKAPSDVVDSAQKILDYLEKGASYGKKPEDNVKKDEVTFTLEEVKRIAKEAANE